MSDESEVRRIEEAERIQAEPWRRVLLDAADLIGRKGLLQAQRGGR